MSYTAININFSGSFRNRKDETFTEKGHAIQYFSVKNSKWMDIVPDLTIVRGILSHRIQISTRTEKIGEIVHQYNAGCIPTMRLVHKLSSEENVFNVLGIGNIMTFDRDRGDTQITFGDNWVQDKKTPMYTLEGEPEDLGHAIVASPRYTTDSPYHKAMKAALALPQKFAEFDPKIHTVTVHKIDTTPGGISTKQSALKDVYSNVVKEVNTATSKLDNTPFKLTNVSLNLKAHVKDDVNGFNVQLVDASSSEHLNPAGISDVKIDIATEGPKAQSVAEIPAPNVVGLTETAARKRLEGFGLKMEVIYQVFKSANKVVGQAAKQMPAAGEDIAPGSTITVIFSKDKSNFS